MINKLLLTIIWFILSNHATLAASHLLWGMWWKEATDDYKEIREWNIHLDNIPWIITWAIDFLMWIAWTIAIIFIIVWWYKIAFDSREQNKTKWKETIFMALAWFALAALSYYIIDIIIDNFS